MCEPTGSIYEPHEGCFDGYYYGYWVFEKNVSGLTTSEENDMELQIAYIILGISYR